MDLSCADEHGGSSDDISHDDNTNVMKGNETALTMDAGLY